MEFYECCIVIIIANIRVKVLHNDTEPLTHSVSLTVTLQSLGHYQQLINPLQVFLMIGQ